MIPIDFGFTGSKVKVIKGTYIKMVSANYLGIKSSQGSHILCGKWSRWVDDPYWFWVHSVKGQGHQGHIHKNGFRQLSWYRITTGVSYIVWWMVKVSRWPLLILRLLGQRSRSPRQLTDKIVWTNFLCIHSPQGSYILCDDWSWWVDDP